MMLQSDIARSPLKTNRKVIDAKVALLINQLTPYHHEQWQACAERVRQLKVLVSTTKEPNRNWSTDWQGLDVSLQKNWMITRKWRHRDGFAEDNFIHIPWDTIGWLKKLKPDVIVSYEMGLRSLFSTVYRARHAHCRLIIVNNISERTEKSRGRLRPILRKYLARRVDFATYNGSSCRRYLLAQGFHENQLLYFPYCHASQFVYQGSLRSSTHPARRLFYCGSLTQRKGILPFCGVVARWCTEHSDREVHLVLGGNGPLQSEIQQLDTPSNLTIELLGSIDPSEIRRQYQLADITVFPTLADEWGLVVNESLASGTPVLASIHAQSTMELCRDNENAWLFDSQSTEDSRLALERALSTPGRRLNVMCQAARDSVQEITPENNADFFQSMIERALDLQSKSQQRSDHF